MTAYTIDVLNEDTFPVNAARLRQAAEMVLSQHEIAAQTGLTIVIDDDQAVRDLNRQFRQIDAPTDVLSFPADAPPVEIEDEAPYLGDLIIAFPYASAQAEREGHELDDSLSLLVVHGTLHLLGYDHDTPERRAEMWAAQARALTALGISTDLVPALEGDTDDFQS
ncbi:MAG: rRNA maturation RNase YbeY [Anaerolineae bacterium]|nr:rRNA maturation RNase YbeY [Anaerolineae bacterium]